MIHRLAPLAFALALLLLCPLVASAQQYLLRARISGTPGTLQPNGMIGFQAFSKVDVDAWAWTNGVPDNSLTMQTQWNFSTTTTYYPPLPPGFPSSGGGLYKGMHPNIGPLAGTQNGNVVTLILHFFGPGNVPIPALSKSISFIRIP